jgi:predicted alpha/beta superfamily hydrolase
MKFLISTFFSFLSSFFILNTPFTFASQGHVYHLFENISDSVIIPRDVYVYLPPNFSYKKKYPVLYMHDGQNLFDPSRAFGGQTWRAAESLNRLIQNKEIQPIILVAIDNSRNRLEEYTPSNQADDYIRFIIDTVRPKVNEILPTLTGRSNTAIMGSSLGGLVSLHACLRYSKVFGKVGALSPSIWWNDYAMINEIDSQESKIPLKVYLDSGNRGGEAPKDVLTAVEHLQKKGMINNQNLFWVIQDGADHSEQYWSQRFPQALKFLFPINLK